MPPRRLGRQETLRVVGADRSRRAQLPRGDLRDRHRHRARGRAGAGGAPPCSASSALARRTRCVAASTDGPSSARSGRPGRLGARRGPAQPGRGRRAAIPRPRSTDLPHGPGGASVHRASRWTRRSRPGCPATPARRRRRPPNLARSARHRSGGRQRGSRASAPGNAARTRAAAWTPRGKARSRAGTWEGASRSCPTMAWHRPGVHGGSPPRLPLADRTREGPASSAGPCSS